MVKSFAGDFISLLFGIWWKYNMKVLVVLQKGSEVNVDVGWE